MATIYAMAGKKTILIGADLRKPKLYIDFDKEIVLDFHLILQTFKH